MGEVKMIGHANSKLSGSSCFTLAEPTFFTLLSSENIGQ